MDNTIRTRYLDPESDSEALACYNRVADAVEAAVRATYGDESRYTVNVARRERSLRASMIAGSFNGNVDLSCGPDERLGDDGLEAAVAVKLRLTAELTNAAKAKSPHSIMSILKLILAFFGLIVLMNCCAVPATIYDSKPAATAIVVVKVAVLLAFIGAILVAIFQYLRDKIPFLAAWFKRDQEPIADYEATWQRFTTTIHDAIATDLPPLEK